jgi:hypothetical protein
MIVLSHTVFIWGPLLSVPQEQNEVVHLLESFEQTHAWRTSWIVKLLEEQWNTDATRSSVDRLLTCNNEQVAHEF